MALFKQGTHSSPRSGFPYYERTTSHREDHKNPPHADVLDSSVDWARGTVTVFGENDRLIAHLHGYIVWANNIALGFFLLFFLFHISFDPISEHPSPVIWLRWRMNRKTLQKTHTHKGLASTRYIFSLNVQIKWSSWHEPVPRVLYNIDYIRITDRSLDHLTTVTTSCTCHDNVY